MFKIVKHPTFRTTARINVPTDEGPIEQTISVRFKVAADTADSGADGGIPWLREHILSMDDLADEKGEPVAYDEQVRDQLIDMPFVRVGLFRAYFDAVSGREAAARGN